MALPILVADDSALARKVLTKSLPEDWDVEVSYASNGVEALALYREGRELNTFVIVVSADVQTEAQERVKAAGAIAFIQKPVTSEKLLPILKEYGIYA
jgi:CheY-like chemotaxis protein